MTEGYNPFPGFLTAGTTCELQGTDTSGLDDGCLAHVGATNRFYRLSTKVPAPAVDGVNVLSTWNGPIGLDALGAPCAQPGQSARSPTGIGRWVRTSILDSSATLWDSGTIIYRPGGVTDGNVFATDVEVAAQVALANGSLTVEVDCSLLAPGAAAPWTVPMDGQGRLTLAGANIPTGATPSNSSILRIDRTLGGVIRSIYQVTDGLTVQLFTHSGPCIIQDDANLILLSLGSAFQNAPGTTQPGVFLPVGGVIAVFLNSLGLDLNGVPVPIVECGVVPPDPPSTGAQILLFSISSTFPPGISGGGNYDGTLKGPAGATLGFIHDASWGFGMPNLPDWAGTVYGDFTTNTASDVSYNDVEHTPSLFGTTLIAPFVQPAFWSTVTTKFASTQTMDVGGLVDVGGSGYTIVTIIDDESITLRALPTPGAAAPGTNVTAPKAVAFRRFDGSLGGSVQNALDALKALVPLASGVVSLDAAGVGTVAFPTITGNNPITYNYQANGVVPNGFLYLSNVNAGVEFKITSKAGALDVGQTVYWQVWTK